MKLEKEQRQKPVDSQCCKSSRKGQMKRDTLFRKEDLDRVQGEWGPLPPSFEASTENTVPGGSRAYSLILQSCRELASQKV